MRKFILILMLALSVVLASCEGKEKEEQQPEEQTEVESLVVENVISTDREFMFLNYGEDYRWFESSMFMEDFLDAEDPSDNISEITNIFQVIAEKDEGFDTYVIMITHTLDTSWVDCYYSFWIEDLPLNDEEVTVTFEEAFCNALEANCPKPHSKCCVLRHELGPKVANAQYIFGNRNSQIYVDAVTGEVSDINPVYLEAPLGEWP